MVDHKSKPLPFKIMQTRKAFLHLYFVSILLMLFGFFSLLNTIKDIYPIISYLALIFGFLIIGLFEFRRMFNFLLVDKHKIELSVGILSPHKTSIYYNKITDLNIKKNLIGNLLNFGEIHINTPSNFYHEIVFKNISNPNALREIIESFKK